jgi:metal-responsive CopG/Arc/MetJ family transcriptional regulator
MNERIEFKVTGEFLEDLDELARKRGTNRSAVIREACRKELQREAMNNE